MSSQRCSWRPRRHPLRISMESFSYGHATSLLRTILGEWWSNGSSSIDAPPPRPRNTGHTGYFVWIACFFCSSASFFCAVSMSCAACRSSCTNVYWPMLNPRYTSASCFVHGLPSAALYNLNKCHVSHHMHVQHVRHVACGTHELTKPGCKLRSTCHRSSTLCRRRRPLLCVACSPRG
jgi:hypothetical protein